ncbi:MAG TPA: hypothetical protein VEX13_01200, partial [Chloroflexia bacterium]|nr:hypothetical protein [Chloroflexia bacterium]
MNGQRKAARNFRVMICLLVLMGGIVTPIPHPTRAQTRTFGTASEGFAYQWEYSDRAVAVGAARRTWLWGPAPLGPARPER